MSPIHSLGPLTEIDVIIMVSTVQHIIYEQIKAFINQYSNSAQNFDMKMLSSTLRNRESATEGYRVLPRDLGAVAPPGIY